MEEDVTTTISYPPMGIPSMTRNMSNSIGEIAAAIAKAAAELNHPIKKCKAGSGNFSYTYADLASVIDAIRPVYAKHGLAIIQNPGLDAVSKLVQVETIIVHTSGEYIKSTLHMGLLDFKPQTIGSAITYARRYALSSMTGLAAEDDDDGNLASKTGNKTYRSK